MTFRLWRCFYLKSLKQDSIYASTDYQQVWYLDNNDEFNIFCCAAVSPTEQTCAWTLSEHSYTLATGLSKSLNALIGETLDIPIKHRSLGNYLQTKHFRKILLSLILTVLWLFFSTFQSKSFWSSLLVGQQHHANGYLTGNREKGWINENCVNVQMFIHDEL